MGEADVAGYFWSIKQNTAAGAVIDVYSVTDGEGHFIVGTQTTHTGGSPWQSQATVTSTTLPGETDAEFGVGGEFLVKLRFTDLIPGGSIATIDGPWTDAILEWSNAGDWVKIYAEVDTVEFVGDNGHTDPDTVSVFFPTFSFAAEVLWLRIRVRPALEQAYFRLWPDGTTEPATWDGTVGCDTDRVLMIPRFGIDQRQPAGQGSWIDYGTALHVDSFQIFDVDGVELTTCS
jgi:hypothetical protein